MFRLIIRPIMLNISVESAHRLVKAILRAVACIPGGRWLMRRCFTFRHPALEREVFGLRFPNPIGLAAGFDTNGDLFRPLSDLGFGFVEIGTVTPRPQSGNPRPRVFALPADEALINRTGTANKGLNRALNRLRHPHEGIIVGCSIGKNTVTPDDEADADYLKVFRNLYQYVDYFTVNIECATTFRHIVPLTKEGVNRILDPLFSFRRGQSEYRPILLKISPDLTDEQIDVATDIMLETPLDGIVATDATLARDGLKTSKEVINRAGYGALSGRPLATRALDVVRRIHERSRGTYPIIGVGGVMTAEEARAMLAAGASLVQVYTGFVYNGAGFAKRLCKGLVAESKSAQKE